MRAAKGLIFAFLLIVLTVMQAGGARLADIDSPLVEASPAYSASDVQAALKEVLPLTEDVTGRKLKRIPPIKLVTREEYMASWTKEQEPRSSAASRQQKQSTKQPRPQTHVDYAFGMYDQHRSTIYLFPGNFQPRLERAGVPAGYYQSILKMVVAHELTHALQHQEVWSDKNYQREQRRRGTRSYSPMVVRALTEGHATFVMDRVAEKLGFPDAIAQFHKTISAGLVAYTEPDQQKANEEFRNKTRSAYLDGKRFIEWHYNNGGKEQVWQVLKHPPTNWSVIEKPATYR